MFDLVGHKRSLNLTIGTCDEHLQKNPKIAHLELETPVTAASTATNFSFGERPHDTVNDLQNQAQQIELLKSIYIPQKETKQETTTGAYSDIMIKSQPPSFQTFITTYKKTEPPQSNHSKRKNAANAKRVHLSQVITDVFSHVKNSGLDS